MTIHDEDCNELKAKLKRLEARMLRGQPAADVIPVRVDLLEDLIQDHEDLKKLIRKYPNETMGIAHG